MTLPYPPPFQDAATLAKHFCITEDTVRAWVKVGRLPPALPGEGKMLWDYEECKRWIRGEGRIVPTSDALTLKVFHATKAAASR